MKCFLSRSFQCEDSSVADWFRDFLQSFPRMEVVEGRDDPRPPIQQVELKIKACDLFCAVVTSRSGAVPQWVSTELGIARSLKKPMCAFVENGINDLGSIKTIMEYKVFCREKLGKAAPEYNRYIFSARAMVLDVAGDLTRIELQQKVNQLTRELAIAEAARDRLDD